MQLFEVSYSIGTSTLTQAQKIEVTALHIGAAKAIVESMFGGPQNCNVYMVIPKY